MYTTIRAQIGKASHGTMLAALLFALIPRLTNTIIENGTLPSKT